MRPRLTGGMGTDDKSLVLGQSSHMGISKRFAAQMHLYFEQTDFSRDERLDILAQAGIPAAALDDPGFPITAEQEQAASLLMMQREQTPLSPAVFGVRFGEVTRLSGFGVVGLAAQSAPDVFTAMDVTTRFPELLWGVARVGAQVANGKTILSAQIEQSTDRHRDSNLFASLNGRMLAASVFSSMAYISQLAADDCRPGLITLPMPEPEDWHQVSDSLDVKVVFDADEATLVYDFDLRDIATINAQPTLFQLYCGQAETLANLLRQDLPLREQVARLLWTMTPPPGRNDVARKLGLSVRSLSRNLQAEGTSFKELFLDIQLSRAKILLRATGMTAASIAFELGFNDPASFSRSFKAQTGKTPSDWREKQA